MVIVYLHKISLVNRRVRFIIVATGINLAILSFILINACLNEHKENRKSLLGIAMLMLLNIPIALFYLDVVMSGPW